MQISPEALAAAGEALEKEAREWVAEQEPYIKVVMEAYLKSGEWPQVEALQQRLHSAGSDLDLISFADLLAFDRWRFYGLGSVDSTDRRIKLRLRAWHSLGGLSWYVSFVLLAVAKAADRYLPEKSSLSASDLSELQSLDDFTWKVVMGLIAQEAFYFLRGDVPVGPREWEVPIDIRRIGRFLKVKTVEDYLLATSQMHVAAAPGLVQPSPDRGAQSSQPQEAAIVTNIYNTTINTAAMVNVNPDTVNVIQSHLEVIGSREPELAQGLARLTEALAAPEFSDDQRRQLEENIEDLAEAVKQPPDYRRWSRIKAFGREITELAPLAPKFLEAWNYVWALIEQLKGH